MRRVGIGILVVGLVALVGVGVYAYGKWDHVRNDESFCTSCHAVGEGEALERLAMSEHAELRCRDCHEQSLSASLRQVAWTFDRPEDEEIGPHAEVTAESCTDCHASEDPESDWPQIAATAGHRVHLEADTSALQGVVCLTCHGEKIHEFVPADATCGQSGCHEPDRTEVVLGEMAGQTDFHCVMCHEFTAPVAAEAPLDTARMTFVPDLEDCRACHEMENVLVGMDPARDPHDAVCGTCHDPHSQEDPGQATDRCAECHAPADTLTPFHRGIDPAVLADCTGCHEAHTFVVEQENCTACHAGVAGAARLPTGRGFPHDDHSDVECTTCHTSEQRHGQVTIESRAQCQECHHTAPVVSRGCAACHGTSGVVGARSVATVMEIVGRDRQRRLAFDHGRHAGLGCAECHGGAAAMTVTRDCASCHEPHHGATAGCATCHVEPPETAHDSEVHTGGCAGSSCHESETYGAMTQGRNTCLACHRDQVDHRPGQTCAQCHRVTFR